MLNRIKKEMPFLEDLEIIQERENEKYKYFMFGIKNVKVLDPPIVVLNKKNNELDLITLPDEMFFKAKVV